MLIRLGLCAATMAGVVVLVRPSPSAAARSAAPSHTVWDSVYTDSQAVVGDGLYKQQCARCHGATLAGTDSAATLTGATFLGNWNGLTLNELHDKILTTMPPDKPSSMSRQQVVDVMTYVLAQNHFPAGTKPLTDDAAGLKDIKIQQSKP
jgi:mono/diheme cytochrome c family protein